MEDLSWTTWLRPDYLNLGKTGYITAVDGKSTKFPLPSLPDLSSTYCEAAIAQADGLQRAWTSAWQTTFKNLPWAHVKTI